MEKKEEIKKEEAKKPASAPAKKEGEKVYVFKGNGKHDGKPFKKGQQAKASDGQIKEWLANGVIVEGK